MKHLKPAFTLMEMLVAMFITLVVVAMAYTALYGLFIRYETYGDLAGFQRECITFEEVLRRDVDKADKILLKKDGVACINADTVSVLYNVKSNAYILRKLRPGHSDTFRLKALSLSCWYRQLSTADTGLTDAFILNVYSGADTQSVAITKYYDARQLMLSDTAHAN